MRTYAENPTQKSAYQRLKIVVQQNHGSRTAEAEQLENAQRKQAARKDRTATTDVPVPIWKCSTCGRSSVPAQG